MQSDEYDPFAIQDSVDNVSNNIGAFNYGIEWKERNEFVLDYAPTVSFRYYLKNCADKTTDFGLLIFVNGIRQPYRTDDDAESSILHIFDVKHEEKKTQTIQFEPIIGEDGDILSVEIISMFQPNYIPNGNTKQSDYHFNHKISSMFPSEMTVTEKTGKAFPAICKDYQSEKISDELRSKYNKMDASGLYSGDNDLDHTVFIETLKNGLLVTPADRRKGEIAEMPFTLQDTVTLCMYGGNTPCQYRVSMYINHKLVSGVFDGADYIDMTPSRDTICKKTIDLSKTNLGLSEYNHMYFIAIPSYSNKNYGERMALKSQSVTLICDE